MLRALGAPGRPASISNDLPRSDACQPIPKSSRGSDDTTASLPTTGRWVGNRTERKNALQPAEGRWQDHQGAHKEIAEMTRTLITWIAAAGMMFAAVSASAAIVTLAGPSTASQGGNILITATGSTGVGPADATGVSVRGRLLYNDPLLNTHLPGSSQIAVVANWTNGVLDCTTARCRAFNQIAPLGTTPFTPAISNQLISTTSFLVDPTTPIGTVLTFNWQTTPASQSLLF